MPYKTGKADVRAISDKKVFALICPLSNTVNLLVAAVY